MSLQLLCISFVAAILFVLQFHCICAERLKQCITVSRSAWKSIWLGIIESYLHSYLYTQPYVLLTLNILICSITSSIYVRTQAVKEMCSDSNYRNAELPKVSQFLVLK